MNRSIAHRRLQNQIIHRATSEERQKRSFTGRRGEMALHVLAYDMKRVTRILGVGRIGGSRNPHLGPSGLVNWRICLAKSASYRERTAVYRTAFPLRVNRHVDPPLVRPAARTSQAHISNAQRDRTMQRCKCARLAGRQRHAYASLASRTLVF
jgi:hypothetical protein